MKSKSVRITILVDNRAGENLLEEHGFAAWIETDDRRILFDTGQGPALRPNAQALDIDLESATDVIFSHGHYDHTGGFTELLQTEMMQLYYHPDATKERYSCHPGKAARNISMPSAVVDRLSNHDTSRIIHTKAPTEVVSGLMVSGSIPRVNDFEDTGGPFFDDEMALHDDSIPDDQCLYFACDKGLVVLLGCAHSGIINTMTYLQKLTSMKIHAVIGGSHLAFASQYRLRRTIEALAQFDLGMIAPAHCTGEFAISRIEDEFPAIYQKVNSGLTLSF